MLKFLIVFFIFSSIFGWSEGGKAAWRALFGLMVLGYGIRLLVGIGFSILPLLILIFVLTRIVIPFVKGFISRFA